MDVGSPNTSPDVSLDGPLDVAFRRLGDEDLPLLHNWLNEPGVVRFWEGDDVSWPGVVAQYGSAAARSKLANDYPAFSFDEEEMAFDEHHVEGYLAFVEGEPVGWIQCYAVEDYDDEDEVIAWLSLGFDHTGAGIDYLVGDPLARGRGVGSAMIRAFIEDVVFRQHSQWSQVGASPVRENVASCRALQKAGLGLVGSWHDDDLGACDLFATRRPSSQQ